MEDMKSSFPPSQRSLNGHPCGSVPVLISLLFNIVRVPVRREKEWYASISTKREHDNYFYSLNHITYLYGI